MNPRQQPPELLGKVIGQALDNAGLSQRHTASTCGIPETTLRRHLRTGLFRVDELAAIAALIGTTPSALMRKAEQEVAA